MASKTSQSIWMEVTRDTLELPIRIADSAQELAEMSGASVNNIQSIASRTERGLVKSGRFHRIRTEEEI